MSNAKGNTKSTKRSRNGCRRCKRLKVKCDEHTPSCSNCLKSTSICDYSKRLTWGGRPFKDSQKTNMGFVTVSSFGSKSSRTQRRKAQVTEALFNPVPTAFIHDLTIVEEALPKEKRMTQEAGCKTPDLKKTNPSANLDIAPPASQSLTEPFLLSPEMNILYENSFFIPYDFEPIFDSYQDSSSTEYMREVIPHSIPLLPDLLLENPDLRGYYHFYIDVFSKLLAPASPTYYTENPFACILPRISLSSSTTGVLSVLIATGILQESVRQNEPFPEALVSNLLSESLSDLHHRLQDEKESQSDYTLALILYLSFFENFRGKLHGWRAHYQGAKKIILSRGFLKAVPQQGQIQDTKFSFQVDAESDLSFFFSRWFAYLDVIGTLCSSSSSISSMLKSKNFLTWDGPFMTSIDRENLRDIDMLMGFDFRLLNYFGEIITLIDEREKTTLVSTHLSISIIERALDIKESLISYMREREIWRDQIEVAILGDPTDSRVAQLPYYQILRATNSVFGLAGILQIYRRVLMITPQSRAVQDVVKEMTHIFAEKIPEDTTAAYCTLFSMFSGGCEALDNETRDFYMKRLSTLKKNGSLAAVKAHELMLQTWSSGKYWAEILAETNSDIIFV